MWSAAEVPGWDLQDKQTWSAAEENLSMGVVRAEQIQTVEGFERRMTDVTWNLWMAVHLELGRSPDREAKQKEWKGYKT